MIHVCFVVDFLEVIWILFFYVNRCSEGVEDENTQEGQAAGLYFNHTCSRKKLGHYKKKKQTSTQEVAMVLNGTYILVCQLWIYS